MEPVEEHEPAPYAAAARELVRAVRGKRSQVALSRRLGYRANPVTDWEAGRSQPDALEVLQAARAAKLPVQVAFERFHAAPPPELARGAVALAEWLDTVRGSTPMSTLAARTRRSRFSVGRWLSAESNIKLADFLELVDAMTGRVQDWVAELVPIASVPSLLERFERTRQARALAFDAPWTEAILRVLETSAYKAHPGPSQQLIAAWLGLKPAAVEDALARMAEAGVVRREGQRFVASGELSVDTRSGPDGLRPLRAHWLGALLERAQIERATDWSAYNVMSVSTADLAGIRERMQGLFREIRATVSASEPAEEVALVLLQLVHWAAPEP